MENVLQENVDIEFLKPYFKSYVSHPEHYIYEIPADVKFDFDVERIKNYFGEETCIMFDRSGRRTLKLHTKPGINYNFGNIYSFTFSW